jgi:hypothetical protein
MVLPALQWIHLIFFLARVSVLPRQLRLSLSTHSVHRSQTLAPEPFPGTHLTVFCPYIGFPWSAILKTLELYLDWYWPMESSREEERLIYAANQPFIAWTCGCIRQGDDADGRQWHVPLARKNSISGLAHYQLSDGLTA